MKKKSVLSTIYGNAEDFTLSEKRVMALQDNLVHVSKLRTLGLINDAVYKQLLTIHNQMFDITNENKQVQLEIPIN